VNINQGAIFTTSNLVTLTLNASDDLSSVDSMIICEDETFFECEWETYQTSRAFTFDNLLGTKTIYVKFKDDLANESAIYSDSIELIAQLSQTPSSSNSSRSEVIQIPAATREFFSNTIVAHPIKDSNTRGQQVLSIIFPSTFDFNAYLSSNHTSATNLAQIREELRETNSGVKSNLFIAGWSGGELMGFKENGAIYWQVSNVQQIYYKAYPALGKDAPVIIPELQEKDSILALKYSDSDLIPPGEPDGTLKAQSVLFC